MHSVCVVGLNVTVGCLKVVSVVQQCFYGKCMMLPTVICV